MTFLAVVSSPLPSSYVVYPVFFVSQPQKIILGREGITRGGPLLPSSPSDVTA